MSTKRYRKTKWAGKDNYECTECAFATLDRGRMVIHVRTAHPTVAEAGQPVSDLAGVDFASDEAAELAAELGVTAARLQRSTPTGKNGYTVADVRAAAPTTQEE